MKRALCLLLCLLFCLTLFVGCGKKDAAASSSASQSSEAASGDNTDSSASSEDSSTEASSADKSASGSPENNVLSLRGGNVPQDGSGNIVSKNGSSDSPAAKATFLSAQQGYGNSRLASNDVGNVTLNVSYPSGDCDTMNDMISGWLNQAGSLLPDGAESGTLTMTYSSYTPNSRIVSVVMNGVLTTSHDILPSPKLVTFNVDRTTGGSLLIEDMLVEGTYDQLVQIISEKAGTTLTRVPEKWVVTDDCFRFFLEDENTLAFRAVDVKFAALADCIKLPRAPMIAFTFDDGPSSNTTRILDLFEQYNSKCSFCVVGERMEEQAAVAKRIVDDGFEISIHTWDHTQLTKLDRDGIYQKINSTQEAIQQYTGASATFLRPPYGSTDETVAAVCEELGLYIAYWSIDTNDWKVKDAETIANTIMNNVYDGCIVLSHDLYDFTAEAMEIVVPQLVDQGYELVTLSDMLQRATGETVPGRMYFDTTDYKYR